MLRWRWIVCLLMVAVSVRTATAGWPFFSEDGIRRGSPEYYEAHAGDPAGARQKYHHGKLWPPLPRPAGPEQTFIHKYHTSHYWPFPYVCEDRNSVRALAQIQLSNGWQAATTLYEYHFDPESNALNSAGQTHLHWILSHAPEQFRQVSVAVAEQPEFNTVRLLSVEREIAKLVGAGQGVPVLLRVTDPVGRPAGEVQQIFKGLQDNMLPPVITYQSASGE